MLFGNSNAVAHNVNDFRDVTAEVVITHGVVQKSEPGQRGCGGVGTGMPKLHRWTASASAIISDSFSPIAFASDAATFRLGFRSKRSMSETCVGCDLRDCVDQLLIFSASS
jgi:hypothetical protein